MDVTKRHRDILIFQHDILCLSYSWLAQKYLVDEVKLRDVHDGALVCDQFTLMAINEMSSHVPSDMPLESRRLVTERQIRPKLRYWHDILGESFDMISKATRFSEASIISVYDGTDECCKVDMIDKIIRMPKAIRFDNSQNAVQQQYDAQPFVKDVDRWIQLGVSYDFILSQCKGLKLSILQHRHTYSHISQATRDSWMLGRSAINKYIDSLHKNASRSQRSRGSVSPSQVSKICPVCGKEFLSNRPTRKYCSQICYRKAQNFQRVSKQALTDKTVKKHVTYTKTCPICNTMFTTLYSFKKYCSPTCASKAKHLKAGQKACK